MRPSSRIVSLLLLVIAGCRAPEGGEVRRGAVESVLFADAFERTVAIDAGLGDGWTLVSGRWFTHGSAETDFDGGNQATARSAACADCRVQARMIGFGVELGVYLRAQDASAASDRYDVVSAGGNVQIRRWRGGVVRVLAEARGALREDDVFATLSLEARGAGPVALTARLDGAVVLQVSDTDGAITQAGYAGLWSPWAGVLFDDFALVGAGVEEGADAGVPDLATSPPDLAQAPTPDLATPPVSGLLFADAFARTTPIDGGLGPDWLLALGNWFTHGAAETDARGNQATARNVSCADCRVEARVLGFGTEVGVFLRAPTPGATGDRYDAVLVSDGSVLVRRVRNGAATVLGRAASGVALDSYATLSLEATGAGPVTLSAAINGATRVQVSDGSAQALGGAGFSGLWAPSAGVLFDDFRLTGAGAVAVETCPFGSTQLASGACGLPDLEIDAARLTHDLYTEVRTFQPTDCEVQEGCIVPGTRRVLRFDVRTWNVGSYDAVLGDPSRDPAHFTYQSCHDHYHLRDYAVLRLLDGGGHLVAQGMKESFCIADTVPGSGTAHYSCANQGLSVGWGDIYGSATSCQYIDITGVPAGSYTLEVSINPDHVIGESNYDNNVARVPVRF